MVKKIIQPDDSCNGCIYEGTPNCQINQCAPGDTPPCAELRYPEPDTYYIYVNAEDEDDEDSN